MKNKIPSQNTGCRHCGQAPWFIDCFFDEHEEVIKVFCARCDEEVYYISWSYDD
jgi:hypothetical protein